jgi:hypothetical protein
VTAPPVLLLDVDGVVNALDPGWDGARKARVAGLTIRWAPASTARIARLHAAGVVEARWCTTWCGYPDQLAELGAVLGLHLEPAFRDRPQHLTWGDLKVTAALAVLAEGRRLAWVDDDEVSAGRDLFPALAAAEKAGRALLIQPKSRYGLTPADMETIEAFAGAVRQGESAA